MLLSSARLFSGLHFDSSICNPASTLVPTGTTAPNTDRRPVTLESPWPSLPPRIDNYNWLRDDSRASPKVLAHLVIARAPALPAESTRYLVLGNNLAAT